MTKDEMGEEIKKKSFPVNLHMIQHWADGKSKTLHNCRNSQSLASMCSSLQFFYFLDKNILFPSFFSIFSPSFSLQCSAQNILVVDKLQPA